jgi:hypothetical protein
VMAFAIRLATYEYGARPPTISPFAVIEKARAKLDHQPPGNCSRDLLIWRAQGLMASPPAPSAPRTFTPDILGRRQHPCGNLR